MIDKQPITYYISCIILGHYGTDIFGLAVKSSRFKIEKKNCIILWCAFATSYSFVFLVFKSTEGAASRLDPFFIKLFLARVQTDVRDQRGFFCRLGNNFRSSTGGVTLIARAVNLLQDKIRKVNR